MKKWIVVWVCAVLAAAGINVYTASTHTNEVNFEDMEGVMDYLVYDALDANYGTYTPFALDIYRNQEVVPYIVKVTATGRTEQHFTNIQMECTVQEVYQGDSSLVGKTIWYNAPFDFNSEVKCLELTYTNLMKEGHVYLLFMDDWSVPEGWPDDGRTYYSHCFGPPCHYFDFADVPNVYPDQYSNREYPLPFYREEKDNEFFIKDEAGLKYAESLKEGVMKEFVPGYSSGNE